MKKANYNISGRFNGKTGTAAIPGYIFMYSGVRYGVSKYYLYNGKPEAGFSWVVTELSTGYSVGVRENTMKAAIDKLVTSPGLSRAIKDALHAYTGEDVNPGLTPATEYLSVHSA